MKINVPRLYRHILRSLVTVCIVIVSISIAMVHSQHAAAANADHRHHPHYAQMAKAPEKMRVKPDPLAGNGDARLAGRKLFEQHCAECHGSTAQGGKKAPSLRAAEVQQAPPGTLFWIVSNGVVRHGMPVWSKLPEAQRWQIITYIKSLGLQTNLQDVRDDHLKAGYTCPRSEAERHDQE